MIYIEDDYEFGAVVRIGDVAFATFELVDGDEYMVLLKLNCYEQAISFRYKDRDSVDRLFEGLK